MSGQDPALRTSDANVQKIFRAMQKYGLIVADNGSDMYITGTFDTRWNNDVLNPAFALLSASDFEVVQLGWKPTGGDRPALASLAAARASVVGGSSVDRHRDARPRRDLPRPHGRAVERERGRRSVPASVTDRPPVATSAAFGDHDVDGEPRRPSTSIAATYTGVQKIDDAHGQSARRAARQRSRPSRSPRPSVVGGKLRKRDRHAVGEPRRGRRDGVAAQHSTLATLPASVTIACRRDVGCVHDRHARDEARLERRHRRDVCGRHEERNAAGPAQMT